MTPSDDTLLGMLLGDTPAVRRVVSRDDAARATRRALAALDVLYGEVQVRPVVHWDELPTPIGRVLVAVGDAGLIRIGFRRSAADFAAELARRLGVEVVRSPARAAQVVRQLRAYFAGERRAFDLPLDLAHLTPFQRRVLRAAATVPAGRVVSYGELARRIGRPRGSRAVGQALGRNPVPIVIPCHRVVAAGGRIGGYTGGLGIKRALLRLEGALPATG
jgi:methylated-DNA-[protein]-cysteine S-methyltransferase